MRFTAKEIKTQDEKWLAVQEEARRKLNEMNYWSREAFIQRQKNRMDRVKK